ncbi:alpha,alpha-trehalose-phosphate synthase (UDP-forming) [Spiribacter vilamensis]|uniref:Trehalose 6-phosphate synthase n=1 Tax=Spiribacter vilamensis TaxID=531306 RepID=A0A4Q8D2P9_9GAMM|nr:trehalose-6-phosphate synthase [Spiribacter vilamensis]RZU99678.1 trehalose 6-phosphate synthase [Spiribacter vilamensis]TVO61371.1 trehalose-6-phosphate synthase [Spiribacter vilamensis]
MSRLIVVSNRVPLPQPDQPQAGGLAVVLSDALSRRGGLWFGWSGQLTDYPASGPDHLHHDGIDYATIPLTRADYDDFYLGYANAVIWPVFHFNLGAMDYQRRYSHGYARVNARFADLLAPLVDPDDTIWIHDYHLMPLARELRERGLRNRIGFFLHIPFPDYDVLRAMPGHRGLLEDLCRFDLLGFQTDNDRHSFEESATRAIGALVRSSGRLRHRNRDLHTGVYPVGVAVDELADLSARTLTTPAVQRLLDGLGERDLVIGVDRLDYSKGLEQRFRAFESLLEDYPHRRGHTVLMQIASPSRGDIAEYAELRQRLEGLSGHINGAYGDLDWAPIHYLNRTFERGAVMGLYRAAGVGVVTPLRDGMNLVAKEFVASQDPDNPGVLVLSELAGAAAELTDAIQVNPYDTDAIAAGLNQALAMPLPERRRRYQRMMTVLRECDIGSWEQRLLDDLGGERD